MKSISLMLVASVLLVGCSFGGNSKETPNINNGTFEAQWTVNVSGTPMIAEPGQITTSSASSEERTPN